MPCLKQYTDKTLEINHIESSKNEELATLNRKIQLTIKPAGGHESGTDDGTERKGQKETGESDDAPDLPRKARHVPSMEIAAPSNGLKKTS